MALIDAPRASTRAAKQVEAKPRAPWSWGDTAWALGWMALALIARGLIAVRIEGMLDDDQGVVGLMALDIAAGRRWPIFFDGQRYMGALEAYTAAILVKLLGHSPAVVALAPALYCGLFVAGQFVLWRRWADRRAGHWAALISAVGSPMLALWGVAPRGGYSEILAWAVPVLGVYRAVTRPDGAPMSRSRQAGWGFLLAFGYFLNPLSLIVYTTLAIDWLLGRHGAELRRKRRLGGGWVDSPLAAFGWLVLGGLTLGLLALGCHVTVDRAGDKTAFVWVLGLLPRAVGMPLGGLILAGALTALAWWTGLAHRLYRLVTTCRWAAMGIVGALVPSLIYNLRVLIGGEPSGHALPIWIRAPWSIGPNIQDGLFALRPLVGCDPHAAEFSVVGQFLTVPSPTWPWLERGLLAATPWAVLLVTALMVTVAWRDRAAWRTFWMLRGREPTRPTVLVLIGLCVSLGLYLLQATSSSTTSIRYLLPVWIFLPGLLAQGLLTWPQPARLAAAAFLLSAWAGAQLVIWNDMAQPSPFRPVIEELERRGVTGIVAPAHLVLLVSDLTQGRLGGVEYHPVWPRLYDRFADRIRPGQPSVCVNDLEFGLQPIGAIGDRLRELAPRYPGHIRRVWQRGPYEIWEADVPLEEILGPGPLPRPR
ncbi:MAG TPA: hypothetical protein VGZ22_31315 [Isosphaeraceae bacterium]|jgi:hypothetical protein|nr:hypothetical protein [Isosphaeraceae bacterium]